MRLKKTQNSLLSVQVGERERVFVCVSPKMIYLAFVGGRAKHSFLDIRAILAPFVLMFRSLDKPKVFQSANIFRETNYSRIGFKKECEGI